MPGRLTYWKGQELFIEAINLTNKELGHEAFYAVILGSDQGRKIYKQKLTRLVEQYRLTNEIRLLMIETISSLVKTILSSGMSSFSLELSLNLPT